MGNCVAQRDVAAVYERQADTVYRVCLLSLKNAADAEDMTQSAFLRLISSGKQFESAEHEKAWLIVTAANLCRDMLRRRARRPELALEEADGPCAAFPDGGILAQVLGLPELLRVPLYLYYYEGYRTAEIAKLLRAKDATVRSWLRRGRELLRTEMGGEAL